VGRGFFSDRLRLRLDHEQSLRGESENPDFPTRTVLGATFDLNSKTSLLAEHEWTDARDRRTSQSRLGLKSRPWTGGTVTSGFNHNFAGLSDTTFGGGLGQTYALTPTLTLEGGFQRTQVLQTARTSAGEAGSSFAPFHSTRGYATASEGDSLSTYLGAAWQPGAIRYQGRIEASETDLSERLGLLASAQTELGRDLGVLTSVVASRQTPAWGPTTHSLDARLGAAWRPSQGATIVLNRLDLVCVPVAEERTQEHTWKLIENLHLNHQLTKQLQTSLHLGAKYVLTSQSGRDFDSLTTLAAWETRWSFTPKWDVGAQAALLSGWRAGIHRPACGLSIGRSFAKNVWVSLGYNFTGFEDRDFTAARYTAQGVYVRFRIKFDQESLGGLLKVIQFE
jgi:hypothetical protein